MLECAMRLAGVSESAVRKEKAGTEGFQPFVRQPSISNIVQLYKKPQLPHQTKTLPKKKRTIHHYTFNYSACSVFCKHFFGNFQFFFQPIRFVLMPCPVGSYVRYWRIYCPVREKFQGQNRRLGGQNVEGAWALGLLCRGETGGKSVLPGLGKGPFISRKDSN
jgi:hypothetical protein